MINVFVTSKWTSLNTFNVILGEKTYIQFKRIFSLLKFGFYLAPPYTHFSVIEKANHYSRRNAKFLIIPQSLPRKQNLFLNYFSFYDLVFFSDKVENPSVTQSQSSEWTEINLDNSSPEEDVPYKKLETPTEKPRLSRQKTLPNPKLENEFSSIKSKMKLDTSISNWISRSSAKHAEDQMNGSTHPCLYCNFFCNY